MTERVHKQQSRNIFQTCSCTRPLSLASLASSPSGGAKGGCAAEFPPTYTLYRAAAPPNSRRLTLFAGRRSRPLALPMGELARLKAVTERVPSNIRGIYSKFVTAYALSGSLIARQLPHRGSQGAGVARPVISSWGNNVGAKRRHCKFQHLQMQFGGIMSKHGTFATLRAWRVCNGSAQKFATSADGWYLPGAMEHGCFPAGSVVE